MSTTHDILAKADEHMRDRAATYDKPKGERSMAATVQAFKAITGIELTETQGWAFMALLKMVRATSGGEFRLDNYEDGAAYFALMGESAMPANRMSLIDTFQLIITGRAPLLDANGTPFSAYVQSYGDLCSVMRELGWGEVINNEVPAGYRVFQDAEGTWWCAPSKATDPPEEFRYCKVADKL